MQKVKDKAYRFLRWTEKYTKTDMVYLTHGGFWLTGGQILTTSVNFILSIAFAYFLTKDTYGTYRYILSIASVMTAFSLTGLSTAVLQSVARGFEGSLRSAFRLSMKWSVPMIIISIGTAVYYFLHQNNILGVSLLIAAVCSPFMVSAGLFASYINGKKDYRRLSIYNFLDNVIPTLLILGALFINKSIFVIVAVYFISNVIVALALYRKTLKTFNPGSEEDSGMYGYSKKMSLLNIIGLIAVQADRVLIFTVIGAPELAIYAIAVAFPEHAKAIVRNIGTILIPKLAEKGEGHTNLGMKRKIFIFSALLVLATALYIFLAPYLFQIFFPKYMEAVWYSQMYALSIAATLSIVFSSVLLAHKKTKELLVISIANPLFQIVITYIFLRIWGLSGVVFARVISAYLILLIFVLLVRKDYEI